MGRSLGIVAVVVGGWGDVVDVVGGWGDVFGVDWCGGYGDVEVDVRYDGCGDEMDDVELIAL